MRVKPKIASSKMPIQTSVAARPSINKTDTDKTLSQTTAVELMPPECMAVYIVSNKVSAVTVWTTTSTIARMRTTTKRHAVNTDKAKLACATGSIGVSQ